MTEGSRLCGMQVLAVPLLHLDSKQSRKIAVVLVQTRGQRLCEPSSWPMRGMDSHPQARMIG